MLWSSKGIKSLLMITISSFVCKGFAAKTNITESTNNSNVPPQSVPAPKIEQLDFMSDQDVIKMADNFKKEEQKRRPSGAALSGTEDMLSKEYVAFRDKLIKARTGVEFYNLINEYDEKYDQIPASANDLKYTIARLAGWLPLRGVIWRMTPMVHKIVVTQQALLASLRNVAEQVQINMPDSHVEAQMLFLTMPSADLMGKQFKVESDFITYLSMEVYAALNKAARRLERLKMVNTQADGKTTPIVFDAKIRFGQDSFGSAYDAFDRFKVMGEGERLAALARVHRRMYNIATMTSYNWNGHLDLRKEIGKLYGVEAAKAELFDILPGEDNVYVKGATRQKRVEMIRRNYKKLYTLAPHGKDWMKLAYYHLHKSGLFLSKAWDYIKTEDMNTVMQIDPEVLMGRKEQVEAGINHLRNLTEATDTASGRVTIRGALSGEEVVVNLKAFYENPPNDLKSLLPVAFAGNEDLSDLRKAKDSSQAPAYKNLAEVRPGKSDVMKFEIGDKEVQFRNYLFGRAKSWDISKEGYGNLFPALKSGNDVAKAMKILNEARGARVVTNGITLFVR